jgi:hypothetical protein
MDAIIAHNLMLGTWKLSQMRNLQYALELKQTITKPNLNLDPIIKQYNNLKQAHKVWNVQI